MKERQMKYIQRYNKEHYVQVKVDLTKEQKQELINICNRQGISIRQFVINSIEKSKK